MQKIFLTILVISSISSCKDDKTKTNNDYKPLILKRIDVMGSSVGQSSDSVNYYISGYNHYLSVENHSEDTWDNFLVDYADKYIDTCKTDLPIWSITFCKPFDYDPYGDSRDLVPLMDHSIVTIGYGHETLHKKYPDISYVQFWNHGKSTYIETLTSDRAKDKGYYDSFGNYKTDFIKEMDKKFDTHFYDSTRTKYSQQ